MRITVNAALSMGILLSVPFAALPQNRPLEMEREVTTYRYINPLLDCGVQFNDASPFRSAVQSYVDRTLADDPRITEISVYFRQMNNGYVFGINENALFSPASMLKVPTMVTVLKLSEGVPGLLKDRIFFETPSYASNHYQFQADYIRPGQYYTTDSLLYHMIVHSDNEAMALIGDQYHNQNMWENFFARAGINPNFHGQIDFMSIRQYATVFRLLYNASFLNRENSEYALDLLSRTNFKDGIRAVVGQVPVADKYGIRNLEEGGYQLHDCGLVYLPGNHYLLGIMTRGTDPQAQAAVIRAIAQLVHSEMRGAARNGN